MMISVLARNAVRDLENGLDRAADYINDGLAEWIDYVDAIKEELGIVLKNPGE